MKVIGNLRNPIDAPRLSAAAGFTHNRNHFIIAIDSIIGTKNHIHDIIIRQGPLSPGSGLGKKLPSVGDISIMGVVTEDETDTFHSLSYTNLHIIYQMARSISTGIALAVRQLFSYPSDTPLIYTI
jgi:putative sporulation protein YyaC